MILKVIPNKTHVFDSLDNVIESFEVRNIVWTSDGESLKQRIAAHWFAEKESGKLW